MSLIDCDRFKEISENVFIYLKEYQTAALKFCFIHKERIIMLYNYGLLLVHLTDAIDDVDDDDLIRLATRAL